MGVGKRRGTFWRDLGQLGQPVEATKTSSHNAHCDAPACASGTCTTANRRASTERNPAPAPPGPAVKGPGAEGLCPGGAGVVRAVGLPAAKQGARAPRLGARADGRLREPPAGERWLQSAIQPPRGPACSFARRAWAPSCQTALSFAFPFAFLQIGGTHTKRPSHPITCHPQHLQSPNRKPPNRKPPPTHPTTHAAPPPPSAAALLARPCQPEERARRVPPAPPPPRLPRTQASAASAAPSAAPPRPPPSYTRPTASAACWPPTSATRARCSSAAARPSTFQRSTCLTSEAGARRLGRVGRLAAQPGPVLEAFASGRG